MQYFRFNFFLLSKIFIAAQAVLSDLNDTFEPDLFNGIATSLHQSPQPFDDATLDPNTDLLFENENDNPSNPITLLAADVQEPPNVCSNFYYLKKRREDTRTRRSSECGTFPEGGIRHDSPEDIPVLPTLELSLPADSDRVYCQGGGFVEAVGLLVCNSANEKMTQPSGGSFILFDSTRGRQG